MQAQGTPPLPPPLAVAFRTETPKRLNLADDATTKADSRGEWIRSMSDRSLPCPDCGRPMEWKGLVLNRRQEDDVRVCRSVWRCQDRTLW